MAFRSKHPRIVSLNRGDTLGGSASLLLLDRVRPARGGRRFRRRYRSRFSSPGGHGGLWLRALAVLAVLALLVWAGVGLLDWDWLQPYLESIWNRLNPGSPPAP